IIQKRGRIKRIHEKLQRIEETGIRSAKKIAALLGEHRASVDLARKLVRIDTEVALSVAPDEFAWVGVDEKIAAELLRELEFHSIIREISPSQVELPGFESTTAAPATAVAAQELIAALNQLKQAPRIAIDLSIDADGHQQLQLASAEKPFVIGANDIAGTANLLEAAEPPKAV